MTLTTSRIDADALRAWVGRTETLDEEIVAASVRGLAATLDLKAAPQPGDELPPLWHWMFFATRAPQSQLGGDGHPKLGGFMPPVPLSRRMWAGGRLEWLAPLRVGDMATRVSRIAAIEHKAGRSGDLVFVTVRHEVSARGQLALTEEHDIVYRAPAQPGDPVPQPQPAPTDAAWSREVRANAVMLFRYSALTFNGHRIHYDRSYAAEVEGYPGLVVHGPLIATLLAGLAQENRPGARLRRFDFKAVRPVFDMDAFRICGKPDGKMANLWAQDHEGWLTMRAEAHFE
ncbi:FAS1-like dehydratase domain-containing protein [Ramlibacter sp. PS4R-6]|uniref:FAS1-like dehydratase domain-containing protein n=1 Tax=Ramlibacter sp. PS4R-6 TaxID=3133438 RepID=UPI0030A6E7B6